VFKFVRIVKMEKMCMFSIVGLCCCVCGGKF